MSLPKKQTLGPGESHAFASGALPCRTPYINASTLYPTPRPRGAKSCAKNHRLHRQRGSVGIGDDCRTDRRRAGGKVRVKRRRRTTFNTRNGRRMDASARHLPNCARRPPRGDCRREREAVRSTTWSMCVTLPRLPANRQGRDLGVVLPMFLAPVRRMAFSQTMFISLLVSVHSSGTHHARLSLLIPSPFHDTLRGVERVRINRLPGRCVQFRAKLCQLRSRSQTQL